MADKLLINSVKLFTITYHVLVLMTCICLRDPKRFVKETKSFRPFVVPDKLALTCYKFPYYVLCFEPTKTFSFFYLKSLNYIFIFS